MAYQCEDCNQWSADGQKHDCIIDEVRSLRRELELTREDQAAARAEWEEERALLLAIKDSITERVATARQVRALDAHDEWLAKRDDR